jgi:hypothetical protein
MRLWYNVAVLQPEMTRLVWQGGEESGTDLTDEGPATGYDAQEAVGRQPPSLHYTLHIQR